MQKFQFAQQKSDFCTPFWSCNSGSGSHEREERETRMSPQHDLIMNWKYNSFIYRVIHIALHFKFYEVHHQSTNCHTQIHRVLQPRTPRYRSTLYHMSHQLVKWCKLQHAWHATDLSPSNGHNIQHICLHVPMFDLGWTFPRKIHQSSRNFRSFAQKSLFAYISPYINFLTKIWGTEKKKKKQKNKREK